MQALASMNATENMKSYARISMQHAQNVENLVPVFTTRCMVSGMSESQKHIADGSKLATMPIVASRAQRG